MANFNDMIRSLSDVGVLDSLFPFILIFTIVYAVLQKSRILGDPPKKNFNVVVALVIAMTVIIPHITGMYPAGKDIVEIMNKSIPQVAAFIIAIIMVMIMIGIFGGSPSFTGPIAGWVVALAVVIVGYIFGMNAGWWGSGTTLPNWLSWLQDSDMQAVLLVVLIFGVVIWFIVRDDTDAKTRDGGIRFTEGLGQLFGAGKK